MRIKPNADVIARLRRRSSRERGVAMVEGAVVFPVMCMFLAFLELAHHSFDGYVTATHVARERAWSSATVGSAIGNCPAGRDDTKYSGDVKYFEIVAGGNSGDGDANKGAPPNTGGKVSAPSGVPGQNGFFKHSADATANIHVNRGGNVFNPTAVSKVSVYCNQHWYGGIESIISSAFHK